MSNVLKRIRFFTNLDEATRDVQSMNSIGGEYEWLPALGVPRVGEQISFDFYRDGARLQYTLRVCAVTYDPPNHMVRVELHMPPHFSCIDEWSKYMQRHRFGRSA